MSNPKGLRVRHATDKQAKTAKGIKDRVQAGEPLSTNLVIEEHQKVYDVKDGKRTARAVAATIARQNMNKPSFLAQLGLTDPQAQEEFKTLLWQGAMGEHPLWPRDKQFAIECMKLLAKGAIAQREQVVHSNTGDMDSWTVDELRFFEANDRRPSAEELREFTGKTETVN